MLSLKTKGRHIHSCPICKKLLLILRKWRGTYWTEEARNRDLSYMLEKEKNILQQVWASTEIDGIDVRDLWLEIYDYIMWRQWLPNFFSQRTTANHTSNLAYNYWSWKGKWVHVASIPLNIWLEKHLRGMVLVDTDPVWHKGIHYLSVSLSFKFKDHLVY